MNNEKRSAIISVKLTNDGKLEIIVRTKSNAAFYSGEPMPDNITKEIYIAENGRIIFHNAVEGRHTPARYVSEQFTFPDESPKDH
jgi:hypothetical protein